MEGYRANTAMRDDLSISFEEITEVALPFGGRGQILPLQRLGVGMAIRRVKLVHAAQKHRECGEVLVFGLSDSCDHEGQFITPGTRLPLRGISHSCPPDKMMVCPVIKEAFFEKRKRMAPSTSAISQMRPRGTAARAVSRCRSFACAFMPTDKNEGQTALIVICLRASSGASSFTVCSSATLASEYAAVLRDGFCVPAVEPRTTSRAPPFSLLLASSRASSMVR